MSSKYNRKDHYYKQAKSQGVRSRAYFKLKELNERFLLIKKGSAVLDLGAWPGGWLQYASEVVGEQGFCLGVDTIPIKKLPNTNIKTLTADLLDDQTKSAILALYSNKFNTLLSDLAPKLSGIKEVDQANLEKLAHLSLNLCRQFLAPGGNYLVKVFKSETANEFFKTLKPLFKECFKDTPDSTRKSSNEFYFIGKNYLCL